MDLYNGLQSDFILLNAKIKEFRDYGIKEAEAEEKYKVEQAKFYANELAKGTKVTILSDLAKGDPYIANLRKMRDKYRIVKEATQESIYALKKQMGTNETMLKLDYGKRD